MFIASALMNFIESGDIHSKKKKKTKTYKTFSSKPIEKLYNIVT